MDDVSIYNICPDPIYIHTCSYCLYCIEVRFSGTD
jgi:hypothetical protein